MAGQAQWSGSFEHNRAYERGQIVLHHGNCWISLTDDNQEVPPNPMFNQYTNWQWVGRMGATATRTVTHHWHPEELRWKLHDSDINVISDPVEVCATCWNESDFPNAFRPSNHLYIIREVAPPL